jgi:selT/selW/selH-like putative selenoprotein
VNLIRSQLPALQISGGNFPVGQLREALGSIFSFCFMASIALVFGAGKFFLPADIAALVDQNKTFVIFGGFLCNILGGACLQSGAFEVYLDGKLIFSKLETGGIPDPMQLVQLVKRALES